MTDDLEVAGRHLQDYGLCRVPGLLAADQAEHLRGLVLAAADTDRRLGNAYTYSSDAHQRVWMLVNRAPDFVELAGLPVAREIVAHALGPGALLSNLSANITGRGGEPMVPHWDQDWAPRPWPYAFAAHIVWMLDAFTEDNGATVAAPGTHVFADRPHDAALLPATGPAGTALIFDGRLWHATGRSRSDRKRVGILAYYCRPFIRQQENFALSLDQAVRDGLSPEQRALFGLDFYEYLNMVGGPPASLPRY